MIVAIAGAHGKIAMRLTDLLAARGDSVIGRGDRQPHRRCRDGAVKLLRAATAAGVRRYLIISAVGAGDPPRDDVAAVLVRLLDDPRAVCRILYVNSGSQPIDQAVEGVLAAGR
jgi:nucleoside-diphosphate-sugar epimerase